MPEPSATRRRWYPTHRALVLAVVVLAAVTVAAAGVLFAPPPDPLAEAEPLDARDARIESVDVLGPAGPFFDAESPQVDVRVTATLLDTDERVAFTAFADTEGLYRPGQRVRLVEDDADPERPFFIVDVRRERPVALLAGLFALAVIALGRWQGVRALAGLVVTFVIIIGFLVPSVLAGRDPVAVALVGAGLVLLATMYLAHGFSTKTTVAIVGTAIALAVTASLAWAFTLATSLTGALDQDAAVLSALFGGVDIRGLLLAGIIIGGLGVLDDVTMSQSATVFQLHRASREPTFRALFRAGMSVGRDHVAAAINTLFLAYAGAALPLLLLFSTSPSRFADVLSLEVVTIEVVRTLVGSIGLVSAVPVTTALAAALAQGDPAAAAAVDGPAHAH